MGLGSGLRRRPGTGLATLLSATICLCATAARSDDSETCRIQSGETAVAACNRVIEGQQTTHRQRIDAYINRAHVAYKGSQYDRAIADLSVVIGMAPAEALAFGNRGNCWYVKNDFERAIEDFTDAVQIDREYTAAYTGRGMSLEARGDLAGARSDYRAALAAPQKFRDGEWAHTKARERLAALGE